MDANALMDKKYLEKMQMDKKYLENFWNYYGIRNRFFLYDQRLIAKVSLLDPNDFLASKGSHN